MTYPRHRLASKWTMGGFAALAVAAALGACGSPSDPEGLGSGTTGNEGGVYQGSCSPVQEGCPCSSNGGTVACGEVKSTSGDIVTCSYGHRTCNGSTWGACIGETNVFKSVHSETLETGNQGIKHYDLGPSMDGGGVCGPCDPGCQSFPDNSNGLDASGLVSNEAGGWTLPLKAAEGGVCVGLQCSVPICGPGLTTSIKGVVYDPAAINPVYNAAVMIPNGPVVPIPPGVSSAACSGAVLPLAVTYTYSGTDGSFTLSGVPIGTSIPLVIQTGRWRRMVNINTSALTCSATPTNVSTGCAGKSNYAGTVGCLTRLPRTQACDTVNDPACVVGAQNIPYTAIGTGHLDAEECMFYRMGVSSSEYTDELGSGGSTGRINIFDDGGSTLASPAVNHDVSYLLGFPCTSSKCPPAPTNTATTNITNPDFESGNLTGWTATNSGSVGSPIVTPLKAYTGIDSAFMGSPVKNNNGLQTLAQTFTAPAGAVQLDFYAIPICTGGSLGGFSATLQDNTAGVTSKTWSKVCSNNAVWVDYNTSGTTLTPGDSYTLTFTNTETSTTYFSTSYVDDVFWTIAQPVPTELNKYDLVVLPCDGGGEYNSANWGSTQNDPGRVNLVNYAAAGGRIFTSHWGREWIERPSASGGLLPNGPFPNVANGWVSGGGSACCSTFGIINSSSSWGSPFNSWMTSVGAAAGGKFAISGYFGDTTSVTTNSRLFATFTTATGDPADFTFDTPVGSTTPVGRVMYTDMHLASGTPSGTFPANCPTQGTALSTQEDAAEYLLFELGSCVSGQPLGGPMQYYPATFTRDFNATCQSGFTPRWTWFNYDDLTASSSNIVFTAYTADSQAQLPTQFPQVNLATASGPNVCPNGPSCQGPPPTYVSVGVDTALKAAGLPTSGQGAVSYASHAWLRVNMTLNPSTDKMTAPNLIGWQQDYDCVPSQ